MPGWVALTGADAYTATTLHSIPVTPLLMILEASLLNWKKGSVSIAAREIVMGIWLISSLIPTLMVLQKN